MIYDRCKFCESPLEEYSFFADTKINQMVCNNINCSSFISIKDLPFFKRRYSILFKNMIVETIMITVNDKSYHILNAPSFCTFHSIETCEDIIYPVFIAKLYDLYIDNKEKFITYLMLI